MGEVQLRPMTPADAPRCAELEQTLFAGEDPWSAAAFLAEMASGRNFCLVAELPTGHAGPTGQTTVVGYAILGMAGPVDDPEFEIHTIGVDPSMQRRGIARALMDQMMHAADTYGGPVFLEVRVGNTPASSMYEAYGFNYLGVRKNYYQPSGADAHTMRRDPRPLTHQEATDQEGPTHD